MVVVDSGHVHRARLELKEPRLELMQRSDVVRAAAFVHRVTRLDAIDACLARLVGGVEGRVRLEQVEA